ncbi:Ff.00g098310.m01.CDS01 [Fusarium sp. VM40]|nr:Ff.00g098310.m01.CDS01 [Fusarium sp. VM40]
MAPVLRARQSLSKDKFPSYFGSLRSQPYNDANNSRGSNPHSLRCIAWNPLGTLVATGSSEKTLRVWNPEKPHVKFSTELKGHSASVEKVAFNPTKDAELCSVSSDGVVKFWDVRTKACFNEVKGLGDAFTLVWAPDGNSLLVGNKSDTIYVLSPTQPTPISTHQQSVQTNQIAFCWSGEKIFVTTAEGRVRVLSYPGFEPVLQSKHGDGVEEYELNGHTSSCLTADLQPTGRYLATGGSDSIIALWDTTDWICQRTITRMVGPVKSLSFTFDGSFVVGGSDEGSGLEISHVETGDHVYTFKTAGACPVVAWAPTRYCLAYSDLGILRIVGVDVDRK